MIEAAAVPASAAPTRVGLLLPSTNSIMEPDLWSAFWPHASVHTSRLPLDDVTAEAERRMLAAAPAEAAALAPLQLRLTVFGCTSAGAILGRAAENTLMAELEQLSGAPVISVLGAVTEVLGELGARSVSIFTPYIAELSAAVANSLSDEGFLIERVASSNLTDNAAIGHLTKDEVIDDVTRAMTGTVADAIFISCTNLRAMSAAADIERALGKPVVTSNGAVVHVARRRLAVGAGREPV
jgi:maleate isomerase